MSAGTQSLMLPTDRPSDASPSIVARDGLHRRSGPPIVNSSQANNSSSSAALKARKSLPTAAVSASPPRPSRLSLARIIPVTGSSPARQQQAAMPLGAEDKAPDVKDLIVNELGLLNEQNAKLQEENQHLMVRLKEEELKQMEMSSKQQELAEQLIKMSELEKHIQMLEDEKEALQAQNQSHADAIDAERTAHREEKDGLLRRVEELQGHLALDDKSNQQELVKDDVDGKKERVRAEMSNTSDDKDSALSRLQEQYDRLGAQHRKLQDVAQSMRDAQAKFKEQNRKQDRLLFSLINSVQSLNDSTDTSKRNRDSAAKETSLSAPEEEMDLGDSPRAGESPAAERSATDELAADSFKTTRADSSLSVQACLEEMRDLKELNAELAERVKALQLYCSRILDCVTDKDSSKALPKDTSPAKTTPTNSSQASPAGHTQPLLSLRPPAGPRSYTHTGQQQPQAPSMTSPPLRSRRGLSTTILSLGGLWDNSGAPKVSTPWPEDFPRTARKLERLPEDEEDKRERERLQAELKMHGISPITEVPEELITPPQQAASTLHAATSIDTTPMGTTTVGGGAGADRRMSTISKLTSYFSGAMGQSTPRKGSDDSTTPSNQSGGGNDASGSFVNAAGLMLHLREAENGLKAVNDLSQQNEWTATVVGHPAFADGGDISPTREMPPHLSTASAAPQHKEAVCPTSPSERFHEIDFNPNPFATAPVEESFHSHSTLWALDKKQEHGTSLNPSMTS